MKNMPDTAKVIETLQAKTEAVDMVDGLIRRNLELEEIFETIQPLLYALSVVLYKDDDSTVGLGKLVEDSVHWINGSKGEVLQ